MSTGETRQGLNLAVRSRSCGAHEDDSSPSSAVVDPPPTVRETLVQWFGSLLPKHYIKSSKHDTTTTTTNEGISRGYTFPGDVAVSLPGGSIEEETQVGADVDNQVVARSDDTTPKMMSQTVSLETLAVSVVIPPEPLTPPATIRKKVLQKFQIPDNLPQSVLFFDLDDTLIPTEWIRRVYGSARAEIERQNNPSIAAESDQLISLRVRRLLQFLEPTLEQKATSLVKLACRKFGVVALVTNARSAAWISVVELLFPDFSSSLKELGIPIIRAVSGAKIQTLFSGMGDYFTYWSGLKKEQFKRVTLYANNAYRGHCVTTVLSPRSHIAENALIERLLSEVDANAPFPDTTLERILVHQIRRYAALYEEEQVKNRPKPKRQSSFLSSSSSATTAVSSTATATITTTTTTNNKSLDTTTNSQKLDVFSVGDSDFELVAARELAQQELPKIVRAVGLVRCRSGLGPQRFVQQLNEISEALSKLDAVRREDYTTVQPQSWKTSDISVEWVSSINK